MDRAFKRGEPIIISLLDYSKLPEDYMEPTLGIYRSSWYGKDALQDESPVCVYCGGEIWIWESPEEGSKEFYCSHCFTVSYFFYTNYFRDYRENYQYEYP